MTATRLVMMVATALALVLVVAHAVHYAKVSDGLDIVQPSSAAHVSAQMLAAKDLVVLTDGLDALMASVAFRSHHVRRELPRGLPTGVARTSRARHTVLSAGASGTGWVDIVHPKTGGGGVSIPLRDGVVIVVPPHWRHTCRSGDVVERRMHDVVSWLACALGPREA